MSPRTFRTLYLTSILLGISSAFVDGLFPELIPAELRRVDEMQASAEWLERAWVLWVGAAWLIATLASTIGLWFFHRWARTLSVGTTLFAIVLGAMTPGALVASGLANTLAWTSAMLWGAIVLAAFTEPIQVLFRSGGSKPADDSNGPAAGSADS
jgi:hypothetical protein